VHITYKLLTGAGSIRLGIRPGVHFRSHDASVSTPLQSTYALALVEDRCEISVDATLPALRISFRGPNSAFTFDRKTTERFSMQRKRSAGDFRGQVWSPGYFRADLTTTGQASLVASTETWEAVLAMKPSRRSRLSTDDGIISWRPRPKRHGRVLPLSSW
jgi:hypothetical protein